MIDDKYIGKLDAQDIRWFDYLLRDKGSEIVALNSLLHDLDCTRVYKDGSRPMQTINYGYKHNIGGYIYIYNKLCEQFPNIEIDYYAKLVARHEENLNFEKEHGVIYYKKESTRSVRTTKRNDESKDMFTGETISVRTGVAKAVKPKDNARTRKARALSERTINFAFGNFKVSK